MVTIYASDFKDFSINEWEDMFTQHPCSPNSTLEGWDERTQVEFELDEDYGTRALPDRKFIFDLEHDRETPFEWSEDLTRLMNDIHSLRELGESLYAAPRRIWDAFLEDGVDEAASIFSDHYDGAMRRALLRMLAELQGVADEYPLAPE